ncbi:MAG: LptE family protein [Chitinophagales bacterium]
MKLRSKILFGGFLLFGIWASGTFATCNVSLNGAQIPTNVNTITIQYFPNQSDLVAPALSQTFTETLKDKFLRESRLTLADNNGDWELSGAIVKYESTPIAPTGNETTALNRLTIGVKVEFTSRVEEDVNWTQTFSRYEDYESTKTLQQVEGDLLPKLSEQLADDIYQKLTQNW